MFRTPPAPPASVTTWSRLIAEGHTPAGIRAQLSAQRWRRWGHAIVLHSGALSEPERHHVGLVHAGPHGLLTAFTAAESYGLRGWTRPETHVLVPPGSRLSGRCPHPVRMHRVARWTDIRRHRSGPVHALPEALLVAAADLHDPRSACGLLAASVQQRLVRPETLADHLARRPTQRHRRILTAAIADIGQGAEALSEIDFVRLCRRYRLPAPVQQRVRREPGGRRRYLDATWRRADGRLVVVEVDGALHLDASRWWDDQLRQNEISLADAIVLRFPSVVVRIQPALVARQLRRALAL